MLMIILSAFFIMAQPSIAEIWERPAYIPDENHLPVRRIQEEQERPDKKDQKRFEDKEKKVRLYKGRAPQHVTPKDP